MSLGHVVAKDPLVDSIPRLTIDGRASAVLHWTGTLFFEVVPTTIKQTHDGHVGTHRTHDAQHEDASQRNVITPPPTQVWSCWYTTDT